MATPREILDLPMARNDADADTIGEYLGILLLTLWDGEESFSGKRPFGNSGWKYEVFSALVKGGAIKGELDDQDYVDTYDKAEAEAAIRGAILELVGMEESDEEGENDD